MITQVHDEIFIREFTEGLELLELILGHTVKKAVVINDHATASKYMSSNKGDEMRTCNGSFIIIFK